MKAKKLMCMAAMATLTAAFGVAGVVTGCNSEKKPQLDDPYFTAPKIADYTTGAEADRSETFASGSKGFSWENGSPFNVWWNPDDVSYAGNKLSLSISAMDQATKPSNVEVAHYYGGEARTEHYYGYGEFEVRMKPANVVGTASTFFSCTGPYDEWYNDDGTVARKNDHDEIDIEFLGKDTTKVQFNYFASGVGGHEYMYDLGFDASVEMHNYGYRWTESDITWFVDGKPVYKVERKNKPADEEWPEEPGRIIMNYWCGTENAESWMGKFENNYSGHAEYEWVKCSATQCPDPISTKPAPPAPEPGDELEVPATGWTDISYDGFDGWGMYTVDKTAGLTISHDADVSGYKCCGMSLAESYSWIKCNIKNNATETADLRIDAKKEGGVGGVEDAAVNGEKVTVNSDAAAVFQIAAGEEVELALKIKDMYIDQLVVFLNSAGSGFATAGNITITGLKGIPSNQEAPEPETPVVTTWPAAPEGYTALDISALSTYGGLKIGKTESTVTISHDAEVTDRYANANVDINFTENTELYIKLKNTAAVAAKLKVTPQAGASAGYAAAAKSATVNGTPVENVSDGVWLNLAVGEEATVIVLADLTKSPVNVIFALNSCDELGTNAATGEITISGIYSKKVEQEVPSTPGEEQPAGDWTAMDVTAMAGEAYTVDKTNGLKISHAAAVAQYSNCNMDVNLDATCSIIKLVIKNEGDEAALVKAGVQNATYACVLSSATVDGEATDVTYGAITTIAAGAEVEIVMYVNLAADPVKLFIALNSEGAIGTNAATGCISVQAYTSAPAEAQA